jgi:hypothetical protein
VPRQNKNARKGGNAHHRKRMKAKKKTGSGVNKQWDRVKAKDPNPTPTANPATNTPRLKHRICKATGEVLPYFNTVAEGKSLGKSNLYVCDTCGCLHPRPDK